MPTVQSVESGRGYFLTNAKSGTAVDLSGGDNVSVIGYPHEGGDNQKWIFQERDGAWAIMNQRQQTYLQVEGGNLSKGNRVICGENQQTWDVEPAENDTVILKVHGHGYVLDLSNYGDSTPGTPVSIQGNSGGEQQRWKIVEQ